MLTAGQISALQCVLSDLSTLETHARRINAMASAQKLPIDWLVVSKSTVPYREAVEHLLAEHEKEAHAAASQDRTHRPAATAKGAA